MTYIFSKNSQVVNTGLIHVLIITEVDIIGIGVIIPAMFCNVKNVRVLQIALSFGQLNKYILNQMSKEMLNKEMYHPTTTRMKTLQYGKCLETQHESFIPN